MATQVIETPGGIAFAGFYFPEILRELLAFLRNNKERLGLTDENEFEVHVQLLRAFSLVGHLNNTRLDTVATELLLDSANLLESVKRLLRLIGVELKSATPAAVDVVLKLSEVTSIDITDFVPTLAEFATDSVPPIAYEDLSGSDLSRGDRVGYCYGLEETDASTTLIKVRVSSSAPDTIERYHTTTPGSEGAWATDIVGQHIFLSKSLFTNGGEFRVTQRLNDTTIKAVRIPGSETPGFVTEDLLDFSVKEFTADNASVVNGVGSFQPWNSVHVNDMLYVGHDQIMPTQVDLDFSTFGSGLAGVWEYFDSERSRFNPADVTESLGTLTFDCTSLLGTLDRSGAEVTVIFLKTGARETVTSVWSGGKNQITTSGLLGQVTASTDERDYHITADWVPFDNLDDSTNDWTQDDKVEWDLPEDQERSWLETDVNLVDAMWFRFRVVTAGISAPVIETIQIDQGDQYIKRTCTQGETIGPQIIGSSTGGQSQEFFLPETPYLDNSETIEVDEGGSGVWVEYTFVDSFIDSQATSRHYMRQADAKDRAKIIFGDGVNGKIPPAGIDNVRASYRVGGDVDGNVGPNTVVSNSDGINGVSEVWNPRSAYGWRIKDGGDTADLNRVKREAPAELRTRKTAVTPQDCERLATREFTDASGTKPVIRAWAEEEKFGVKTIGLIVVGAGGNTLTRSQLDALDEYFNGDRDARPVVEGVLVMNHKLTSLNYEPSLITIETTVVWPGGNAESIKNQLLAYVNPLAVEEDGSTYVFNFGSQVSFSRVHSLIHAVDPAIQDVPVLKINGTAASASLTANELPITTAASIQVNVQEA